MAAISKYITLTAYIKIFISVINSTSQYLILNGYIIKIIYVIIII